MTESEREAARARVEARHREILRARRIYESLPQRRQAALRESYQRAEDDAAAVVQAGRRSSGAA